MKVKIKQIREDDVDNLSISWDEEDGFVLLYTPYMVDKMEHFHIMLSKESADTLQKFIAENI